MRKFVEIYRIIHIGRASPSNIRVIHLSEEISMKRRLAAVFAVMALAVIATGRGHALSFALDSIAEWGKFPRFCVKTYRWGDKFFNSFDSAYVEGTGYKFNIKAKSELWKDSYIFSLPENYRMHMSSEFNMSGGFHVS